jgi:hypothetical protein
VEIVDRGAGYFEEPDITFSGGGGSTQAKGQAVIRNGLLNEVRVLDSGAGYSSPPEITISGGNGSGAALSVGLTGTVDAFELLSGGTGFTEAPTITFNNVWQEIPAGSGVTYPAAATCSIDGGVINEVRFSDYGRGATTDVQATFTGGGGTGLSFDLDTKFGVQTVTASNTGQGYFANPVVIFKPDANDDRAQAAEATAVATSLGNLQAITVTKAGVYYKEPTAEIAMPSAVAVARLSKNLKGEYHCYTRYLDDTPLDKKGPIPSSISAHAKVTIENGARAIQWDFTHPYVDDRVARMELWRSSPDQNVLLFRIATLDFGGNLYTQGNVQIVTETGDNIITEHSEPTTYTDTVNDEDIESQERGEFGMMPITLPTGRTNARRFLPPPGNMGVAVYYQDRAWYTADQTGQQPNTLRFSEPDEPESVPGTNVITLQESINDTDHIVGLVPMGYMMLIVQSRHLYTLMYVSQPVIDANIQLAAYRGILNPRCADVMEGIAFIADTKGMYTFDGTKEEPISVPIDNFWREAGEIDFTKKDQFFIKCDVGDKTTRFFYCNLTDTEPTRSFCYCWATKTWWKETYSEPVTCGTVTVIDGRVVEMLGGQTGKLNAITGYSDNGSPIPYSFKTGEMILSDEDGARDIGILYTPTEDEANINLNLHFNASPTARPNAIASNPGAGFISSTTSTKLNMQKTRSSLGDANGMAFARYSGRGSPKSAGGDKHMAIAVTGQQSTSTDAVNLHVVTIKGVE